MTHNDARLSAMVYNLLNKMKEIYLNCSSYSAFLPAVISIFKYKNSLKSFQPFFYFIWLAAANEALSILCKHLWKNNAVNSNIYVLIEFIILLWLFYLWNQQNFSILFYRITGTAGVLIWIVENLIFHSIATFDSLFRVLYSFMIVYLSIEQLNLLILQRINKFYLNAQFIICSTFLLYFTYRALCEVFFFVDIQMSIAFYTRLYIILLIIILFSNLLYAIAAICIPTKQKFILPYL